MIGLSTPVVLFIFNRPKTTRKVFEAISRAKPRRLYIVSDGPRANRSDDRSLVEKCREIVAKVGWECEVKTKYSDENLGCKLNVVGGLDWVFSQENEAIILEDDCVPTLGFFDFCEEMLGRYRDNPRIGSISGSNLEDVSPLQTDLSYWFSKYPEVWGWATWKRAWAQYEVDLAVVPASARSEIVNERVQSPAERRYWNSRFNSVASGKLDTWDYQLAFMHWRNNLLSVIPSVNLISNIGFGPDATHTVSPPAATLQLTPGKLRWPLTGPTAVRPFQDYEEMVVRNRFSLGVTRWIIELVYLVSPGPVKVFARRLFEFFTSTVPGRLARGK